MSECPELIKGRANKEIVLLNKSEEFVFGAVANSVEKADEIEAIADHIVKAVALYRDHISKNRPTNPDLKQMIIIGEAIRCPNGKWMFVVMVNTGGTNDVTSITSEEWWDAPEEARERAQSLIKDMLSRMNETGGLHSVAASTPSLMPNHMNN